MPSLGARLAVVENGVSLAFQQVPDRVVRERPIIVSVGRLSKPKNYGTALQAIALLLQDHRVDYRIAGAGPEEGELRRLCDELRLGDRVRFLGFVENVPQLLREADIFLMPSRWEGFGLSAVEAMNAGLPVVASDVEGLREIVAGTPPCGILVSPLDPSSIARGLKELLLDPEKRRCYGAVGHSRSCQFSLGSMVDKYLEFYSSVLSCGGGTA
jgi:glycosyltransferase involved in cell wall biosynthesis